MTFKVLAATLALAIAPTLGFAEGCAHDKQVMSCAEGSTFNPATGSCTVDATT